MHSDGLKTASGSAVPMNLNGAFDGYGNSYNVSKVLDEHKHFDAEKYVEYTPPYLSAGFLTSYMFVSARFRLNDIVLIACPVEFCDSSGDGQLRILVSSTRDLDGLQVDRLQTQVLAEEEGRRRDGGVLVQRCSQPFDAQVPGR